LVILVVTAVPVALANLSCDGIAYDDEESLMATYPYGWPLVWYWRTFQWDPSQPWVAPAPGLRYGMSSLALNVVVWCAGLVVVALACEVLFRRFPPRLRWSLKTMLSVTALVAVGCAWFAVLYKRAAMQDPTIAEIEGMGGGVELERWGPLWLDLVGADRFRRRIVGVQLVQTEDGVSVELLSRLARLSCMSWLDLDNSALAPGAAAALADLTQVRVLYLNGTGISNNDLKAVAELEKLEVLHLGGNPIDDDSPPIDDGGLVHVGSLVNLEELYLGGTKVQGEGLKHLSKLEKLRLLDLSDCPLTDAALESLPLLENLETLYLWGTGVDDYELPQLAKLRRLKVLDLAVTRVTEQGLIALQPLDALRDLGIGMSAVSPVSLESLLAWRQLRSVHLVGADTWQHGNALLRLDGGDQLSVPEADRAPFQRALESLRSERRCIWVDSREVSNPKGRRGAIAAGPPLMGKAAGQRVMDQPPRADRDRGPPPQGGFF
jgi:hypothetical protein